MKGIVVFVNMNRGMVVVKHDQGFTVVELFGDELEVGEVFLGRWEALGSERITQFGNKQRLSVYMQGCWGSMAQAVRVAS